MKPGQESQTAVFVAMGRAYAHGTTTVAKYSDPTALTLLPEEARLRVERARAKVPPVGLRGRLARTMLVQRSKMMVARTVAIDDAIRAVPPEQLVILGAGLDGRAWRMAELRDAVVFEVDHPDSQRQKRARVGALEPESRDIRFVPVDFTRDSLDEALAGAGHDASRPTTWIWEGVVMYLTQREIEATLAVINKRSAARSRLVVVYHHPAPMLGVVGMFLRRVGEPLRSAFREEPMRRLLAKYGFGVISDESVADVGRRLSGDIARASRPMRHLRVVIADRVKAA